MMSIVASTEARDELWAKLDALRKTYRDRMNRSAESAQLAAAEEDMDSCSLHSTESARFQEAFSALNQALKIVEGYAPI